MTTTTTYFVAVSKPAL